MVTSEAEVRGTFVKFIIRSIKRHPGSLGDRLREELPEALRAQVRAGSRMDWFPASLLGELADYVYGVGSRAGAEAYWRGFFLASIDFPLVKPLAVSAVRLFGPNPGSLVRRTPQTWELVSRGCAKLTAEDSPEDRAARLCVTGMTPALRTRALLPMFSGGFMAQMDFVQTPGQVALVRDRLADGALEYELRW